MNSWSQMVAGVHRLLPTEMCKNQTITDIRRISTNLFKNQICPSIRLSRLRALGCVRRCDKVSILPDPHHYGAHRKCLSRYVLRNDRDPRVQCEQQLRHRQLSTLPRSSAHFRSLHYPSTLPITKGKSHEICWFILFILYQGLLLCVNFRAHIFKHLWSPGIDFKEWILPAWRVGTIILFLLGA